MESWYQFTLEATDKFMKHEFDRLQLNLDRLVQQNDQIRSDRGEEKAYGFLFNGIKYRMAKPVKFFDFLPGSEFQIDEEIKLWMEDKARVSRDHQLIRQICTLLLMPAGTYQEARNALPDEIAECHPKTAQLSRTQEIDYSIFQDRTKRQLDELRDLISFYSATRLVY